MRGSFPGGPRGGLDDGGPDGDSFDIPEKSWGVARARARERALHSTFKLRFKSIVLKALSFRND